jgi:hypothetical protein
MNYLVKDHSLSLVRVFYSGLTFSPSLPTFFVSTLILCFYFYSALFIIPAPTNDAFDAIPTELLNLLLLPENIKKLQGILLYHVLSGSYPSSDLTSGDRLTLPTVNGESVTISINDNGVMVNDANVIQTDIIACNGIIHVIDSVLLPPGDDGTFGPDIGDDDEMMSMPRTKAALEDWSQAEKEYFLQNFAL